jgi:hypothetical protein
MEANMIRVGIPPVLISLLLGILVGCAQQAPKPHSGSLTDSLNTVLNQQVQREQELNAAVVATTAESPDAAMEVQKTRLPVGSTPPRQPPAQPAAPGKPAPSATEAVRELFTANVAYNTPDQMWKGRTTMIRAALDRAKSREELSGIVQGAGQTESRTARVANTVQARLVGEGFEIKPVTAETQPILSDLTTQWEWSVTPVKTGELTLTLVMDTFITTADGKQTVSCPVFERPIRVKVKPFEAIWGFVSTNQRTLLDFAIGGPLAAVIGLLTHRQIKRKRAKNKQQS